jgi:hypothetical protein
MSTSYHVVALRERDADFEKHFKVLKACKDAGISLPKEVADYFGSAVDLCESAEGIGEAALEVDIDKLIATTSAMGRKDLTLDLADLPKSVKRLIFRVIW